MTRRFTTPLFTMIGLALALSAIGQAQTMPLTRHTREAVLNGSAAFLGRLPADQEMQLTVALPLRNRTGLDMFLRDVYNPSSPNYHQYLTVEEFTAMFGPTPEDYESVIRFVQTYGLAVVETSRNRITLEVAGPAARVEEALHVTLGLYQHPTEGRTFFAPDREPTPDLEVQLWTIEGLDNYSIPRPLLTHAPAGAKPNATTGSCPGTAFCGSDMRLAYYGNAFNKGLTGNGQTLGLLEYLGTNLADLATYYTNAKEKRTAAVNRVSVGGANVNCNFPACDDTEQTLDMTQALGMAPGLKQLNMYIGNTDGAILNAMAAANPLDAQLSSSWTWTPADPTTDDPFFMMFAAQGQNFFQASGDSRAWKANSPIWPADDEYITSVGGTVLITNGAGGPWKSETAWANGGGGISPNKVAIPVWQMDDGFGGKCPMCSTTLRNGPDVSANSDFSFYVCADQKPCTSNAYGGTSFAAPMWAGYLALANEQAVNLKKPPLGFINPELYSTGLVGDAKSAFHDIIMGNNGFPAGAGYDLATGWGSPNKSGLINILTGK